MTWTIEGVLTTSSDNTSLTECSIEAVFEQKRPNPAEVAGIPSRDVIDPPRIRTRPTPRAGDRTIGESRAVEDGSESTAARASTYSNKKGEFSLTLPDRQNITSPTVRFVVSEPSGAAIGQQEFSVGRLRVPVEITVDGFKQIVLRRPDVVPQPATRRIRGRVVERNGNSLPASLQVVLFVRHSNEDEEDARANSQPVLATKADRFGYFSGEVPNQRITAASAVISGVRDEVPINLEDSFTSIKTSSRY
jgi:hypothetical protein